MVDSDEIIYPLSSATKYIDGIQNLTNSKIAKLERLFVNYLNTSYYPNIIDVKNSEQLKNFFNYLINSKNNISIKANYYLDNFRALEKEEKDYLFILFDFYKNHTAYLFTDAYISNEDLSNEIFIKCKNKIQTRKNISDQNFNLFFKTDFLNDNNTIPYYLKKFLLEKNTNLKNINNENYNKIYNYFTQNFNSNFENFSNAYKTQISKIFNFNNLSGYNIFKLNKFKEIINEYLTSNSNDDFVNKKMLVMKKVYEEKYLNLTLEELKYNYDLIYQKIKDEYFSEFLNLTTVDFDSELDTINTQIEVKFKNISDEFIKINTNFSVKDNLRNISDNYDIIDNYYDGLLSNIKLKLDLLLDTISKEYKIFAEDLKIKIPKKIKELVNSKAISKINNSNNLLNDIVNNIKIKTKNDLIQTKEKSNQDLKNKVRILQSDNFDPQIKLKEIENQFKGMKDSLLSMGDYLRNLQNIGKIVNVVFFVGSEIAEYVLLPEVAALKSADEIMTIAKGLKNLPEEAATSIDKGNSILGLGLGMLQFTDFSDIFKKISNDIDSSISEAFSELRLVVSDFIGFIKVFNFTSKDIYDDMNLQANEILNEALKKLMVGLESREVINFNEEEEANLFTIPILFIDFTLDFRFVYEYSLNIYIRNFTYIIDSYQNVEMTWDGNLSVNLIFFETGVDCVVTMGRKITNFVLIYNLRKFEPITWNSVRNLPTIVNFGLFFRYLIIRISFFCFRILFFRICLPYIKFYMSEKIYILRIFFEGNSIKIGVINLLPSVMDILISSNFLKGIINLEAMDQNLFLAIDTKDGKLEKAIQFFKNANDYYKGLTNYNNLNIITNLSSPNWDNIDKMLSYLNW